MHQELINKDIGFINAYLEDVNRPYLDKHIFLLYKDIPYFVDNLLTNLPSFYNKYTIRINGVYYTEYVFFRTLNNSNDIKTILSGNSDISSSSANHIFYFYRGDDVYNYIHYHKDIPLDIDILPIEDYVPIFSEQVDLETVLQQ